MFLKHLRCKLLLAALFMVSFGYSQNKIIDDLLLKAYQSKDSSAFYFNSAYNIMRGDADSANYFYFKAYKFTALDKKDSAIYYFNKAIPLLKKVDSLNRLRKSYNELHYYKLDAGNYEGALEYSQKALSLAEILKDTASISLHLSDIGSIYHDFEDYERGISYGKEAYSIINSASKRNYKYLIFANNIIGINFDDWGKPDSALFYHYKNIELLKNVEDTLRFTFVYNNIGNTLLKQRKYSEAKKYQLRALAMDKLKDNHYFLASDYTNMATIAYNEGNNKEALAYFAEAGKHAKLSGSIEKIRDLTLQKAWFYKKIGDYKKAFEFQEQFFVLRDSVFNTERAGIVSDMEVKYETEKKERDLALARAFLAESQLNLQRQNLFIYGLLALAIILGTFIYLIYAQHKLKTLQLVKENELKTALEKIKTQNQLQEQRLRISRDLHDNIGSQLTFIISSIDSLTLGLEGETKSVAGKLAKISLFTSQTICELRDTIWAMNKMEISVEDLKTRISNFIEKAKLASNINFNFNVENGVLLNRFDSVRGMNIYRIIQEGVNNAIKHSGASSISVSLSKVLIPEHGLCDKQTEKFKLEISDNGKGFDKNNAIGNGISNIQRRTADLGGRLEIVAGAGKGSRIEVFF